LMNLEERTVTELVSPKEKGGFWDKDLGCAGEFGEGEENGWDIWSFTLKAPSREQV